MTALYVNLFCITAVVVCLGLLAAVGIQLDFGEPEYAGPKFSPGYEPQSQAAEWAKDFASVRAEIASVRAARHARREETGWWANTDEFAAAARDFFADEEVNA